MPTQARVSRSGVIPVSWSLDHIGGFTRSVEDARLLLEALSGEVIAKRDVPKTIRVGVLRQFFAVNASPETRTLHENLLGRLHSAPFVLEEAKLPEIFSIQSAVLNLILRAELASAHTEYHRAHATLYGHKLRGLIETGMLLSANDYLRALRLRHLYQQEMLKLFQQYDVLLSPGAKDTAPEGIGYTGDPGFSGPWALADFPTITLPQAIASNGLPVGIQLTAAPMKEPFLFDVAEVMEDAIGFRARAAAAVY
jgi:Asp-tRNA(Asn)/Glu-tRNA(Gln) amidotransferase A subunit family amidase